LTLHCATAPSNCYYTCCGVSCPLVCVDGSIKKLKGYRGLQNTGLPVPYSAAYSTGLQRPAEA